MLRAVLVGFILGFALVGVLRLPATGPDVARLTGTSAMKPGAAVDWVAARGDCPDGQFPSTQARHQPLKVLI